MARVNATAKVSRGCPCTLGYFKAHHEQYQHVPSLTYLVDDRVAPPPVREAPFFKPPNDFILANKPPFLLVVLVVPVVAVAADDDEEAAAVLGSVRRLLLPTLWGVDGVDRYLVSQTMKK